MISPARQSRCHSRAFFLVVWGIGLSPSGLTVLCVLTTKGHQQPDDAGGVGRARGHARGADQLRGHVELLRCYYNFIRPHRALRFGRETRTPAMQAGLVSQRLALRDIFTAGGLTRRIFVAVVHVSVTVQPTESDEAELSTRCSPSARRQAA